MEQEQRQRLVSGLLEVEQRLEQLLRALQDHGAGHAASRLVEARRAVTAAATEVLEGRC